MATATEGPLCLAAATAADLMAADVATLPRSATFQEALGFFIDRNVNVAPVVGDRDEPVGVLSLTDLLIHVRESTEADRISPATAGELMTPTIFSVSPDTPAADVVGDMLRSKVHHLFVTDPDGTIMGMVSACDVLRHLH
jgi:CBS-domain-containing membrane protein